MLKLWICMEHLNNEYRTDTCITLTVYECSNTTYCLWAFKYHLLFTRVQIPLTVYKCSNTTYCLRVFKYHLLFTSVQIPLTVYECSNTTYCLWAFNSFPSLISSSVFLTLSGTVNICFKFSIAVANCRRKIKLISDIELWMKSLPMTLNLFCCINKTDQYKTNP